MTRKPKTKRFLGRTLTEKNRRSWYSEGWPCDPVTRVAIGQTPTGWRVIVTMLHVTPIQVSAPTERAARNAMVRKLRRLRDELSDLEF